MELETWNPGYYKGFQLLILPPPPAFLKGSLEKEVMIKAPRISKV